MASGLTKIVGEASFPQAMLFHGWDFTVRIMASQGHLICELVKHKVLSVQASVAEDTIMLEGKHFLFTRFRMVKWISRIFWKTCEGLLTKNKDGLMRSFG